ncbi:hypothetical protein MUY35_15025 [Aliiroseovarius sp. S1339]|uniref:hypothetical protein n=1 Tax=Aliiroseovarius sp. S1339 TaxID=2936990 RepID=UPI0020BDBD97|nr:hypothetical protein [Aliiroseovarius sp. S1339]MCK8465170.1 hypothetical protein [Aliiroseovarius sp. S1339]
MPAHKIGNWFLYIGKALTRARLLSTDGVPFGYLFGIAVDDQGALVEGDYTGAPSPDAKGWDRFEDWVEGLTGRWGVVLIQKQGTRLYTDASGMIGAVYDAKTSTVSASLALCLTRDVVDHPDYDHSAIEERGAKYSLFDTRDAHVRRMNPSCYLDLETFHETRFWPRPDSIQLEDGSLGETYDWLGQRTERVFYAIAKRHKCWLPLSGGQDSRLLLAMAGQARLGVEMSYTHISNYANRIDATIAKRLAQIAGIKHEVHDKRDHRTKQKRARVDAENYYTALGFKMPPSAEMKNGLHLKIPRNAVVLRGHQTDIIRAVFSSRIGERARNNTRWQVLRLLIVPQQEFNDDIWARFRPRYEAWLNSIPDHARKNSTDLMFLEMYYSSTVGCMFPAFYRNFWMSPFNGRAEIGRVMAIDENYRHEGNAVHDIVDRFAPNLNEVPFDYELGAAIENIDNPEALKELTRPRREATDVRRAEIYGTEKWRHNSV